MRSRRAGTGCPGSLPGPQPGTGHSRCSPRVNLSVPPARLSPPGSAETCPAPPRHLGAPGNPTGAARGAARRLCGRTDPRPVPGARRSSAKTGPGERPSRLRGPASRPKAPAAFHPFRSDSRLLRGSISGASSLSPSSTSALFSNHRVLPPGDLPPKRGRASGARPPLPSRARCPGSGSANPFSLSPDPEDRSR